MAEVKLSLEEYHNLFKGLNTLIKKLYEMAKEGNDYKRQRDELINDMAETKRKAEAWDKLKEEKMNDYKRYSKELEEAWGFDYITRPIENHLGEMEIILQRMDQLDGTHEFRNLLSDLEEQ
ncbi:hypothetical protein MKR37_02915 [Staphylococcus haemolyticus]|uniref:hypothetical protein n=1 Tax=Staphylococcus haemolyticus TaxID=1283 RepID=UPI001F0B1DD5|nr:hypothetical protein [Staphylococcus haemolyticus]MCH4482667.1 hypothetical protein [Staphylococcus haemolyticus]